VTADELLARVTAGEAELAEKGLPLPASYAICPGGPPQVLITDAAGDEYVAVPAIPGQFESLPGVSVMVVIRCRS
jgi:hypothetical protein